VSDEEQPVAGWYPDIEVPGGERYWNGEAWTEHRRPGPSTGTDPWTGTGPSTGADPWTGAGAPTGPVWGTQPMPTSPSWTTAGQQLDTWLWQSIVATILCCQPFGIVGIAKSAQAGTARDLGAMDVARKRADEARTWTLVAGGVGLVLWVLYFLFFALSFGAAFSGM
jgi:hypothetical protein